MSQFEAIRYHDICYGHRVHNQGGKCQHLHGHNGRVHFHVQPSATLDSVGRVLDFSVIKQRLCMWLEDNWDHKFLIWNQDPLAGHLIDIDRRGVVKVPFNPTAENMAEYLVETVGPIQLKDTGVILVEVKIEETAKCSATYKKD